MSVERTDEEAWGLIRFLTISAEKHKNLDIDRGEILDAIADVIKSTGRNRG